MPLKTMFSEPLATAVAYLAEVSAMPSIISGSLLGAAHWVVSSSCTSSDAPVSLWAMDVSVLLQPVSISAARSSASAKTKIRFVFFMVFYPQKSQKSVLLQGMIRI